ncbi:cobalt ECF transporter T component CbiQ [Mesorhizobium australicum]|jgi:cobalt/nickel transport system permease protein|uniref:Cobalt/nickel transport system permease protein n=2 Tax=Mesorhizobium australicum TaxID=536018 RepID=A0A1X7MQY1_9HYPH|nr:cobalt ECF transporter T component CbiQ [Mesorhizobium australicum]SMH26446.1 cobalt/nickel transport system permease protein [Mesorhizobium australicum]
MSGNACIASIFVEDRDAKAIARVDPCMRLAAALLFVAVLAFLRSPAPLTVALATGIAAVSWARPPARSTLRRLAGVEGFLALFLVSLPFTVAGTEMFSLFGYPASREGLERALAIVVRVNAAALVIAALISTMGTMRLASAMAGIGIPARIAHLFQLTVRYIGVFHEEYSRLRRAMMARAFRAGSNQHSWRTLGNLVGMLLVRSIERAERVSWAMKSRGFSGSFPDFDQQRMQAADIAFCATWIGVAAALVVLEFLV